MTIDIKTTADDCHIAVSIRIQNRTLLTLRDNDQKSIQLIPGVEYEFDWEVFTGQKPAHANIQAKITPLNSGFPPLDIDKNYPAGVQDGNTFLFTLN